MAQWYPDSWRPGMYDGIMDQRDWTGIPSLKELATAALVNAAAENKDEKHDTKVSQLFEQFKQLTTDDTPNVASTSSIASVSTSTVDPRASVVALEAERWKQKAFVQLWHQIPKWGKDFSLPTLHTPEEITRFLENPENNQVLASAMMSVKSLNFFDLQMVPPQIVQCNGIKELSLRNCNLTALPEWICNLKTLKSLGLDGNHLSVLPEWISQLKGLKYLSICNNQFSLLPEQIKSLPRLACLEIYGNQIASLPDWVDVNDLTNLAYFYSWDNPFWENMSAERRDRLKNTLSLEP